MIKKLKFFFIFSLVFCSNSSSPLFIKNLTPLMLNHKILCSNEGIIYGGSRGGLFQFNTKNLKFTTYNQPGNLDFFDINTIFLDIKGYLWLGSNDNQPNIQIFNTDNNTHFKTIHLPEVAKTIHKIVGNENYVFASVSDSKSFGIISITNEGNRFNYKDYYEFFPSNIDTIYDLDISSDSLIVSTNAGVFLGDLDYSLIHLKNSTGWNEIFESYDRIYQISLSKNYFITADKIYSFQNSEAPIEVYSNIENFDNIIQLQYDDNLKFLTNKNFFILNNSNELINYDISIGKEYVSFSEFDSKIYFSVNNFGLIESNVSDINTINNLYSPNCLFSNQIYTLSYSDEGIVYGVGIQGGFRYDRSLFVNFINSTYLDQYPIDYFKNYSHCKFYGAEKRYIPGPYKNSSLVISNNDIYFNNNGILPGESASNSNRGALIKISKDFSNLNCYNNEFGLSSNGRIRARSVVEDNRGNIWTLNAFSDYDEGYNIASVLLKDNQFQSVKMDISSYDLPTDIAFDNYNRPWIGFQRNGETHKGGLKVGGEDFLTSQNWIEITNIDTILPGGNDNVSVWSLEFDKNGFLWVLTSRGVQGYAIQESNNSDVTLISLNNYYDFFTDLPFYLGDKIKVDPQDNKWIATQHSGIRVISSNQKDIWPTEEGLTSLNSDLLSDIIYDITFDYNLGYTYIATNKGISVLETPYAKNFDHKNISISPNPFIIPEHDVLSIYHLHASSFSDNSITYVKIMTLNGTVVMDMSLSQNESKVVSWDGRNNNGDFLTTGIYLVAAYNNNKSKGVTKLAVIRK